MVGDETGKSFKVEDRRRFSQTGEPRPDAPDDTSPARGAPVREEKPPEGLRQGDGSEGSGEITFAGFIMGLSTQALALLGEIRHPEQPNLQVDLNGARQVIDILGLLQEKTRGNLDDGEQALLESALYDLRMIYVNRTRKR